MRVPSPKDAKEWDKFWRKYKKEKALLEAHSRGELREEVSLELLNMHLLPRLRAGKQEKGKRRLSRRK